MPAMKKVAKLWKAHREEVKASYTLMMPEPE
jgi:hypothetical protein